MVKLHVTVDAKGARAVLRRAPKEFRQALVQTLRDTAMATVRQAQHNIIQTRYGRFPIQAFGGLLSAMAFRLDVDKLLAEVGPLGPGKRNPESLLEAKHYGWFVEHGRGTAGRPPPPAALYLWVKRKMGVRDPRQIKQVAFLISRKQKRLPIPPRPFLTDAMATASGGIEASLARRVEQALKRIAQ